MYFYRNYYQIKNKMWYFKDKDFEERDKDE